MRPRIFTFSLLLLCMLPGCPTCLPAPPLEYSSFSRIHGAWNGGTYDESQIRLFGPSLSLETDGTFTIHVSTIEGDYDASGNWGVLTTPNDIGESGFLYFSVGCSTLRYLPAGNISFAQFYYGSSIEDREDLLFYGLRVDDEPYSMTDFYGYSWSFHRPYSKTETAASKAGKEDL